MSREAKGANVVRLEVTASVYKRAFFQKKIKSHRSKKPVSCRVSFDRYNPAGADVGAGAAAAAVDATAAADDDAGA